MSFKCKNVCSRKNLKKKKKDRIVKEIEIPLETPLVVIVLMDVHLRIQYAN
jgi:hypothetical protein